MHQIIPFLTGTFGIFLTKQFMLSIPNELTDAATVDGCSAFGIYWRIILPMSKPIIVEYPCSFLSVGQCNGASCC